MKKEETADNRNQKRFSKFEVKMDHRKSSRNKDLSASRTLENFKLSSQFIEIKSQSGYFGNQNNYGTTNSPNKLLRSNNSNSGFSLSLKKKQRKDAFGVPIVEKSKKHKVSFLDLLLKKDDLNANNKNDKSSSNSSCLNLNSKNKLRAANSISNVYNFMKNENEPKNLEFVQVIKIESFKKYNLQLNEDDNKDKAICSPCSCSIF